jgi:HEAT repeat protein
MMVTILEWAIVGVAAIAALLLLGILLQRWRNNARRRWWMKRRDEILPAINGLIQNELTLTDVVNAVGNAYGVAETIILGFLGKLTGEDRKRLLEAAVALGLVKRSLSEIKSRDWTRRDIAAMIGELTAVLTDPRTEVRYTAARSLGLIGSPEAADALLSILDRPELVDTPRVLEIVLTMKRHATLPLSRILSGEHHPLKSKLLAIDLVGDLRDHTMVNTLHEILHSTDKEKVVRALKALGRIGAPSSVDEILTRASHPAWEVRAQAMKAIGQLQISEGLTILVRGLSDKAYWVRRNAAEALVAFGEEGYAVLRSADELEDGFAQDISRYQLQRIDGVAEHIEDTAEAPREAGGGGLREAGTTV